MTWLWGFAIFGGLCAVAVIVALIMFLHQVDHDGWNQ